MVVSTELMVVSTELTMVVSTELLEAKTITVLMNKIIRKFGVVCLRIL
jgi:hypothetical protein